MAASPGLEAKGDAARAHVQARLAPSPPRDSPQNVVLATYSLHTTYYSLLTTHNSLLATHYSLLTTRYSLLTTRCSLLTTHYLPRITHYSLLTTHCCRRASPSRRLAGSSRPTFSRLWAAARAPTDGRPRRVGDGLMHGGGRPRGVSVESVESASFGARFRPAAFPLPALFFCFFLSPTRACKCTEKEPRERAARPAVLLSIPCTVSCRAAPFLTAGFVFYPPPLRSSCHRRTTNTSGILQSSSKHL